MLILKKGNKLSSPYLNYEPYLDYCSHQRNNNVSNNDDEWNLIYLDKMKFFFLNDDDDEVHDYVGGHQKERKKFRITQPPNSKLLSYMCYVFVHIFEMVIMADNSSSNCNYYNKTWNLFSWWWRYDLNEIEEKKIDHILSLIIIMMAIIMIVIIIIYRNGHTIAILTIVRFFPF